MSTKRRARKPADFYLPYELFVRIQNGEIIFHLPQAPTAFVDSAKDCRRLAKWLMAASSYLEQQEKKK